MATIAVYLQDPKKEPTIINCPAGSVFYWARRVHQLVRPPLLHFTAEVQNLPYLGFIAQPNDAAFETMVTMRTNPSTALRMNEQSERAQTL